MGPWTFAPGWRPDNAPGDPAPFEPYTGGKLVSQNELRASQWLQWDQYYRKMSSHIPRAVARPGRKPKKPLVKTTDDRGVELTSEEEYGPESEDGEDEDDESTDGESERVRSDKDLNTEHEEDSDNDEEDEESVEDEEDDVDEAMLQGV